jgi:hypothetical protein
MPFMRRAARVVPAVAIAAAIGCNRGQGSDGSGAYAQKVAEAVPRVEEAVGLKFKQPPRVQPRSKAQVREFIEREFNESHATGELAFKEAVYKRLGLIPDTLDLRKLFTDLLEEQIAGFYDPKTKELYIVEGSPPEAAGLVLSHELVHALQDQYMNLDSLQHVEGDDDGVAAVQAVVEGQAMVAQLGGANFAARLPGGWDRVRQLIRENRSAAPIFAGAPMLVQETLIFPYLSGAEFVRQVTERGIGSARLYADPPRSTEQIMHPETYVGSRDAPTRVTVPAVATGTVAYQNTLGEFETRLFLFQHLQDVQGAARGARGWDGDRYLLVDTPQGQAFAWVTVWDSAVDAGEFEDLAGRAIAARGGGEAAATTASSQRGTRSVTTGGRTYALSTGEVKGRPVVLYVDVPAGASTALVNLRDVQLQ